MLTTTADDPLGKADSKLRCFTTADAIDGEWIEHSASPLLNDPLIGRNGGLLHSGRYIPGKSNSWFPTLWAIMLYMENKN